MTEGSPHCHRQSSLVTALLTEGAVTGDQLTGLRTVGLQPPLDLTTWLGVRSELSEEGEGSAHTRLSRQASLQVRLAELSGVLVAQVGVRSEAGLIAGIARYQPVSD